MADNVKVRVDLREFTRALQEYEKHSSRDLAVLVKGAAIDVSFNAAMETKSAKVKDLPLLNSGLFNSLAATGSTRFGKAVKGEGNAALARRIFNARRSATGYSKALFLRLAQTLGAKVMALRKKIDNATTEEQKSRIRPAVTLKIAGVEDPHMRAVLEPSLQAGINAVAAKYWKKVADKLAKRARAHSGRKR